MTYIRKRNWRTHVAPSRSKYVHIEIEYEICPGDDSAIRGFCVFQVFGCNESQRTEDRGEAQFLIRVCILVALSMGSALYNDVVTNEVPLTLSL